MRYFSDISKFTQTSDYLPILNAAMIVDMFVILMLERGAIKSKTLGEWYKKFHLGAYMADVLSLVIGVVIARFVYTFLGFSWSLLLFLVVVVLVQLCHDLIFAFLFYKVPRDVSSVLDVFKDYANELGPRILLADSQMMVGTVLLGSLFANMDRNSNIVLLIFASYLVPYFVFSVK